MNVSAIQTNNALSTTSILRNNAKSDPIAFKATPKQILDATQDAKICGGKKTFLNSVAQIFSSVEEQLAKVSDAPKEFIYKLGKENNIPKSIANLGIERKTADGQTQVIKLSDLDKELNKDTFRCSPTSTCNCGVGYTKGSYMTKLLEMIGVEKPDEISITKK